MGSFLYPIILIGSEGEVTLEALMDTGATYTWAARPILERLGVRAVRKQPFALADGRVVEYDIGEARCRIDGNVQTIPVIFGEPDTEPLLGVVTLEIFGLGVDPLNQTLIPVTGRLK